MTPLTQTAITVGLIVNAASLLYTVLKVSFVAGELTQRITGNEKRLDRLEKREDLKTQSAYAGRG